MEMLYSIRHNLEDKNRLLKRDWCITLRNISFGAQYRRSIGVAAALVLGAVTALAPTMPASAVDVTNPGFENGTAGWAPLSGTTYELTSSPVHTGSAAAKVTRKSASGPAIAGLTD